MQLLESRLQSFNTSLTSTFSLIEVCVSRCYLGRISEILVKAECDIASPINDAISIGNLIGSHGFLETAKGLVILCTIVYIPSLSFRAVVFFI